MLCQLGPEYCQLRSEYSKDGKLVNRSYCQGKKVEGERKLFYKNGQPLVYEFYRDGMLEGERK